MFGVIERAVGFQKHEAHIKLCTLLEPSGRLLKTQSL